jgi:hypothetical protein
MSGMLVPAGGAFIRQLAAQKLERHCHSSDGSELIRIKVGAAAAPHPLLGNQQASRNVFR